MRILVIEDDKDTAEGLRSVLTENKYLVDVAYDGIKGLDNVLSGVYNLVLIDINLPKFDGFSVFDAMKNNNINTPVIFLTADSSIKSKLRGLQGGASDYITKPFDKDELLARISLRIYASNFPDNNYIKFGDTSLDKEHYLLISDHEKVKLSKKEFQILEILMSDPTKIIERRTIFNLVWGHEKEFDGGSLDSYISFLRKKLKFIGSNIKITTKKGVGYVAEEK